MMGVKIKPQEDKYKIAVMALLLLGTCFLTYYFHAVLNRGTLFTHLFYIPIILGSLWWKRKGLVVAMFLGAVLIFSHIFFRQDVVILNDYFRSLMFLIVAFVVAMLSERLEKSEESLRKTEERFRSLVETTSDWIWELDSNGIYTYASPKIRDLLGYEPEEVIGKRPFDLMPPDEAVRIEGIFHGIVESREPFVGLQNINLHRDGRSLVLETSGVPIFDAGGKFLGYRGIDRDTTERWRAEEALRESEEKLDAMLQSIGDHMSMMDKDLNIIWANEIARKVFGNDIIGKKCYEAYHRRKEPCEPYPCLTLKAFQDGKTHQHDTQVTGKDGEIIYFHCTANVALRDEEGKPTGVIEISRDVSERKKAEEDLRKSENKHRTLLENLPQKIFLKDKNSLYISCNENYARDLKIKLGEIAGKADFDFHPKELAEKYRADDKRIMESGRSEDIEEEYIQDGQKVFVHTVKTPVKDEDGNVVGVLGIFWDISQLKRAQTELAEAHAALARHAKNLEKEVEARTREITEILQHTPAIVFLKDKDGRYLMVNRRYEELFNLTNEEIRGKTDFDIFPRETAEQFQRNDRAVLETGEPIQYEETVPQPDGVHTYLTVKFSLTDAKGSPRAVCGIAADITERKRISEALLRSERLAGLGELAGSVSHELRNPLGAIKASVFYLRSRIKGADEKVRNHLDRLENSVASADRIISDLLSFARAKPPEFAHLDLNAAISKLIPDMRIPKPISVVKRLAEDVPIVKADRIQIEQLLRNILLNALDAMPEGGELHIETEKSGSFVKVALRDTGVGISRENLEKVFEPLFTTRARGSGFGLAICKQIVEAHGGNITLESEEGKGTVVRFSLPQMEEASA